VLKKENFKLPLILSNTPAITPVIAAACLANTILIPLESSKKKVYFSKDLYIYLFLITRARARKAEPTLLQLLLLELYTKPTYLIILPKRTSPLLLLAIKNLLTKEY
jgi:hypothetical protein